MVQPMNQKRLRLVQTCDLLKPGVPGTEKNMERFLEDMAIVRPDVVLVTGDVSYVGRQDWYDMLKDWFGRLEAMNIRCVAIPGNHERAGWAYWLRNFGPELNHRVDIGPLAILSLDSAHGRDRLTPFQFRWLETQLENLGGRTPLIQIHHPIFPAKLARNEGAEYSSGSGLQGLQKAFVRLCREKQVPMIFSGHWHADAVFDADGKLRDDAVEFAGPKFVTTTTLASEHRRVTRWPGRHWGYRVIEIEDGKVARYTHQNRPIASETLGQAKGGVLP